MENIFIRPKDIKSVQNFQKGWTDYLVIKMYDGSHMEWSVYHYEESMSQIERCKKLNEVYRLIIDSIKNNADYIEFKI